jgi:hypothetical protein
MTYDYEKLDYGFRNTFDAGYDEETCQSDAVGVDVYRLEDDSFVGHADWVTTEDIESMDYYEFDDFIQEL